MRELTTTLLAAQQKQTGTPYVKVEAVNKMAGVLRLDFTRLYEGSEDDYLHAVTVPGDGSIVRVRVTPPADAQKLYYQRVADPSPESDFSQWTYASQYNAVAVAAASLGSEVSIFWIKSNREIRRIKSTDYGASWGSSELIDYTATTAVYGLAAAYKPDGDMAIFFADQNTLYVKEYAGGSWQTKVAWDKTTGELSGVACVYDGDWNLLLTGQDTSDNYQLWSLVYGDGGDVAAGTWPDLKELAAAPADGDFEYGQPFLDKPDVYRAFYVERFTGAEAYNRPFHSHTVADTDFIDGLWREPSPFALSSEYGLAIAHQGDYVWLSSPGSVWRAPLPAQSLDLTADIVEVRQETGETAGSLTVELRNDDGRYAAPGEGDLSVLDIGCQLEFGPGYITPAGEENSPGQGFYLEAFEHTSAGGQAVLVLHARDGWAALDEWKGRCQFRWNKDSDDMSVRDILSFVLARVGLRLEVVSQSAAITGFYPDFTISPGSEGRTVIRKLLSFVPDVIFIEGNTAYLVNPLVSDSSVYSYGGGHPIWEGRYIEGALRNNRVQVEGYDTASGDMILADSFSWEEINSRGERLVRVEDMNIGSVAEAQQRGEAYLRKAGIAADAGNIIVPVNCGQQLYDVIAVTDARAGLEAQPRRVLGMVLLYNHHRGEYRQRLNLGAV